MLDGESEPVEDGTSEVKDSQDQGEPSKKVLLVEDNHVNLKVCPTHDISEPDPILTLYDSRLSRRVSRTQDWHTNLLQMAFKVLKSSKPNDSMLS